MTRPLSDRHTRAIHRATMVGAAILAACFAAVAIGYDCEAEAQACAGAHNRSLCELAWSAGGARAVNAERARMIAAGDTL